MFIISYIHCFGAAKTYAQKTRTRAGEFKNVFTGAAIISADHDADQPGGTHGIAVDLEDRVEVAVVAREIIVVLPDQRCQPCDHKCDRRRGNKYDFLLILNMKFSRKKPNVFLVLGSNLACAANFLFVFQFKGRLKSYIWARRTRSLTRKEPALVSRALHAWHI